MNAVRNPTGFLGFARNDGQTVPLLSQEVITRRGDAPFRMLPSHGDSDVLQRGRCNGGR